MQLEPQFTPKAGAYGWQVSNPPILAMAPLRASMALFDAVGMEVIRSKSERLTAYFERLLGCLPSSRFVQITPRDPAQRGSQLSLRVRDRPRALVDALETEGVVCDFREPDVVRVAPAPLYNSFHDVWTFVDVLRRFFG